MTINLSGKNTTITSGIKNVQRGNFSQYVSSGSLQSLYVPISTVNVNKSFVVINWRGESSSDSISADVGADIYNSANLRFYVKNNGTNSGDIYVYWEVVEFQ
jgi:hypothetical protein